LLSSPPVATPEHRAGSRYFFAPHHPCDLPCFFFCLKAISVPKGNLLRTVHPPCFFSPFFAIFSRRSLFDYPSSRNVLPSYGTQLQFSFCHFRPFLHPGHVQTLRSGHFSRSCPQTPISKSLNPLLFFVHCFCRPTVHPGSVLLHEVIYPVRGSWVPRECSALICNFAGAPRQNIHSGLVICSPPTFAAPRCSVAPFLLISLFPTAPTGCPRVFLVHRLYFCPLFFGL